MDDDPSGGLVRRGPAAGTNPIAARLGCRRPPRARVSSTHVVRGPPKHPYVRLRSRAASGIVGGVNAVRSVGVLAPLKQRHQQRDERHLLSRRPPREVGANLRRRRRPRDLSKAWTPTHARYVAPPGPADRHARAAAAPTAGIGACPCARARRVHEGRSRGVPGLPLLPGGQPGHEARAHAAPGGRPGRARRTDHRTKLVRTSFVRITLCISLVETLSGGRAK